MTLRIYNTLSHQKEDFKPIEADKVRMYVCGPTVYAEAHVGHAMSSIVFDVIRRYLEYRGYQVKHVMNYTDVDDKIIQRANQAGIEPSSLAEKYIQEYHQHLQDLNVLEASLNPRATNEINQIIQMVKGLIEKGYAYAVDGDVYFRVEKDEDYGKLSGRRLEDMLAGARIEVDVRKENPMDFTLWKAAKPGEPAWDSPWGQGRPGWHIECSAMSTKYLGQPFDIHGGGHDLMFPHHENEIAQSEGAFGSPLARYWIHNGLLTVNGEKMSKSLGNYFTIQEILEENDPVALRHFFLGSHYRSPMDFSKEGLREAGRAAVRGYATVEPAAPEAAAAGDGTGGAT